MRCCTHACCEPVSRLTIWLPRKMIAKARRLAPRRMRSHVGCILAEALWDYVVKRQEEAVDRGIRRMVQDQEFLKAMAAPYFTRKIRGAILVQGPARSRLRPRVNALDEVLGHQE